ncbi:catabolite repression protein creC [Histoplasma capsulatum G186AR]|uniref:Catabolite repression protein creC n=1 Tax=Ajellomyces capsulatus TaxID=5037 RepID=A0A8H7Z3A4_AJECA|nr:catabolite repression protein creC [Histoplasma capsulatum]QSS68698.1 catabolite repression protein creC [Histoplasma capsulatum G186AR]
MNDGLFTCLCCIDEQAPMFDARVLVDSNLQRNCRMSHFFFLSGSWTRKQNFDLISAQGTGIISWRNLPSLWGKIGLSVFVGRSKIPSSYALNSKLGLSLCNAAQNAPCDQLWSEQHVTITREGHVCDTYTPPKSLNSDDSSFFQAC